jgi:hypothetical protein
MNLETKPLILTKGQTNPTHLFARTLSALVTTAKEMLILSDLLNTEEETISVWDDFESELEREFPEIHIQIWNNCSAVDDNVQFFCHVILQKPETKEIVSDETGQLIISRICEYFSETV